METMDRVQWLRRVGTVVVVMTFALMVLGSWVKATGSGLSCPDWPRCYGEWMPPFPSSDNGGMYQGEHVTYTQAQILYEWSHRAVASLVSVALVAFAVLSVPGKELHPATRWLPLGSVGFLCTQILLGGVTVLGKNAAPLTTAHLANALLLFLLVVLATVFAFLRPLPEHPPAPRPRVVFPGEEDA